MFTDMVGYTALGQRDESLSLALVEEQRKLIRPILDKHDGREVKTMGDAFLVEFPSALEAMRCAFDIQQSLNEFNDERSSDRRIRLRIGLHSGDVVHRQSDVYGDAVNVASRIEPLAEPGGICLSQQIFDQVKNKFDFPMVSLGNQELKNVEVPTEVYKVILPWDAQATHSEQFCMECYIYELLTSGMILIEGPPGSGKSSLATGLMRLALQDEQPIIFITTGLSTGDLREKIRTWGGDPEKVRVVDCYKRQEHDSQFKMPKLDLDALRDEIASNISGVENPYLIFDSLDQLAIDASETPTFRFVLAACRVCKANSLAGCAVVTSSIHSPRFISMLRTAFEGVIELKLEDARGRLHRMLRIQTLKGAAHPTDLIPFDILDDGILIGTNEYRSKLRPSHTGPHMFKFASSTEP